MGGQDQLSELQPYEVSELLATTRSVVAAADAMHVEPWEQREETVLAFQNLGEEGADEVQEDLSDSQQLDMDQDGVED